MRQDVLDRGAAGEHALSAAEVPGFLEKTENTTIGDGLRSTATASNGRTSTEENVNSVVRSEEAPVIVSSRYKQDERPRSSSENHEEHHPVTTCDQSTQVNHRSNTDFHSNQFLRTRSYRTTDGQQFRFRE